MGGSCIMAVSAGRILILPKGSYDSTTTYEFLDAVYYQGSTYICKKTALNVLPSNTEYWQIMAQGTSSASVAGNYYAECDTSASTPAKVITVPATEYFVLQVGDIVNVKFTYTNTATNPTLNINNTGNKTIVYDTSAVTTDNLWAGGEAGRITSFMYDGTNWVWISHDVDTNTLDALLDTAISSPTNKQGLIFNGTSNKWENKSLVAGDVIFDNTGTDLVSNNVNDSIVEVNDKKTNNSNLAPIEATTTASRSYLVGDYLMLQGEFYKVISAIAIGDTLTVGTNIQATSVGDEIDEVDNKTTIVVEKTISNVPISTQWGQLYISNAGAINIDITSLGFSNFPTILSCVFEPASQYIAWPVIENISLTNIKVQLVRGSSANGASGKIVLQFKKEI